MSVLGATASPGAEQPLAYRLGGYRTRREMLPVDADRAGCSLLNRRRGVQAGEHSAGEGVRRREDL